MQMTLTQICEEMQRQAKRCETIAQALREHVEHLLSEPDAFCSETPQIFATAYDPLLAQKGASDLVLQEYFR